MGKWQTQAKRRLPRLRDWLRSLRIRHVNLPLAMILSLIGAVAIATFAAWVLAPQLNVGTQRTSPADLTRIALTIAAGVGGVVALVVAYRRQRDLEQSRFVESFGAAAKQLGDSDVAVRLAGVYAMAGVADQASKLKQQQCIDVLCGYLRLPYSPELGNNHQSTLVLKKPVLRKGGPERELQFQYRQNDKVVRQTIVRVIVAHLQKKAPHSWSSNTFDFTGAHLEEPMFNGSIFNGKMLSFFGATFSGELTTFENATFSGGFTLFIRATSNSEETTFNKATFSGEANHSDEATFSGELTTFVDATFSGEDNSFIRATFNSEVTTFNKATFSGEDNHFELATFNSEVTEFNEATFSGYTDFADADFAGGVTFANPLAWDPPPIFTWDMGSGAPYPLQPPANVKPQRWPPPVVAEGRD